MTNPPFAKATQINTQNTRTKRGHVTDWHKITLSVQKQLQNNENGKPNNNCITWPAGHGTGGTGAVYYQNKKHSVHRVAYATAHNHPPAQTRNLPTITQTCNNKRCYNILHLQPNHTQPNGKNQPQPNTATTPTHTKPPPTPPPPPPYQIPTTPHPRYTTWQRK